MSNQAIQDAIAQAKAAAGAIPAETGAEVVNYVPQAAAPRPVSLMDNMAGSFGVDAWLKVKPFGFTIGKDNTLFESLELLVDLSAVQYCKRVRFGNPAEYRSTYDHVNDSRGGLWADTVARASRLDPKFQGEYRSADIPFTVVEDIKSKSGEVIVSAGQKIGYAPSVTGWALWSDFIRRMQSQGINPEHGLVKITAVVQFKKNASGEWGLLEVKDFSLVS